MPKERVSSMFTCRRMFFRGKSKTTKRNESLLLLNREKIDMRKNSVLLEWAG